MNTYSTNNLQHFRFGMLPGFLLMVLTLVLMSCGSSKNASREQNYEQLKNMVHNQRFEIENQWANPLRGGMINLIGNPNHLRFSRDSVDVFLPYFGQRQSGGGYGQREGGIVYKGVPEDLNIIESEKKKNILIRFSGQQGSENLRFLLELYPDGGANIYVNSSQRDAISYRGDFSVFPEKQKQSADILLNRQN